MSNYPISASRRDPLAAATAAGISALIPTGVQAVSADLCPFQTSFPDEAGGAAPARPKANLGNLAPWQLRRAQELIAAHLDGNLQVAEIAAECRLSTGYFERAFARSTGQPPHRWLRDRRLARSKELLLGSGLSIAEIALECGFADQAHLTRLFGTAVGMSPGRWRRMNRC